MPLHASPSSQGLGVPTQTPLWQVSPVVHALPSSQRPLIGVKTQPTESSQLSAVHWLPSSHTSGVPAEHVPPFLLTAFAPWLARPSRQLIGVPSWQPVTGSHVSVPLHGFPSSHGTLGVQAPVVGSHVSTPLQGSPSSHTNGVPGTQPLF